MELKINGETKKLNFGVRFAHELDESEVVSESGLEFGIGIMATEEKLKMGSLSALVTVIKCALHQENVTTDEVYDALDECEDLETVFKKVEEELKNSNAVRTVKVRAEKVAKEAQRQQGVRAVKPTKK